MFILAGLTTLTATTQIAHKLELREKWIMLLWVDDQQFNGPPVPEKITDAVAIATAPIRFGMLIEIDV